MKILLAAIGLPLVGIIIGLLHENKPKFHEVKQIDLTKHYINRDEN